MRPAAQHATLVNGEVCRSSRYESRRDAPTVAHNVKYALVNFVLLYFADDDGYSVDRLRRTTPPVNRP
jgi:hypothetical protein